MSANRLKLTEVPAPMCYKSARNMVLTALNSSSAWLKDFSEIKDYTIAMQSLHFLSEVSLNLKDICEWLNNNLPEEQLEKPNEKENN